MFSIKFYKLGLISATGGDLRAPSFLLPFFPPPVRLLLLSPPAALVTFILEGVTPREEPAERKGWDWEGSDSEVLRDVLLSSSDCDCSPWVCFSSSESRSAIFIASPLTFFKNSIDCLHTSLKLSLSASEAPHDLSLKGSLKGTTGLTDLSDSGSLLDLGTTWAVTAEMAAPFLLMSLTGILDLSSGITDAGSSFLASGLTTCLGFCFPELSVLKLKPAAFTWEPRLGLPVFWDYFSLRTLSTGFLRFLQRLPTELSFYSTSFL